MKTSAKLFGLALCFVCLMAFHAWAGELLDTELNEFTSNSQALAVEVNENFDAVQTEVNDNDSRITAVESGKQARVVGTCPAGQSIRAIDVNGAVTCEVDTDTNSGGDVTAVYGGTGLSGSVTTGSGTISADTTYLQRRVSSCPTGYSIQSISETGSVTCEYDTYYTGDMTAVYAGTGLIVQSGSETSGNVTLAADTAYLQRRSTTYCSSGYAIRQLSSTGYPTCQAVGPTTVSAGTNVTGGGSSGAVTLSVPGVAGFDHNYIYYKSLSTSAQTVTSDAITAPATGYIIAIFSSSISSYHYNGTTRQIHYGLSDSSSYDPTGYSSHHSYHFFTYPSALPTAAYGGTAHTIGYFSVSSGQTKTIYARAKYVGGTGYCYFDYNPNLILIFVSKIY